MDRWIEYPSDPNALLLTWQAPKTVPDRLRWIVGKLSKDGDNAVFRYLDDDAFAALNAGRTRQAAEAAGYAGYPAFHARRAESDGAFRRDILAVFLRRLPPVGRSDYPRYLEIFRLRPVLPLSGFALLGATEARLPGDGFSLIDPLDAAAERVDAVFEITGFSHHSLIDADLQIGISLTLEAEPDNPRDPDAVRIIANGAVAGYVNRVQAKTVLAWLATRRVKAWLVRLNGKQDARRAYGLLCVRPMVVTLAG